MKHPPLRGLSTPLLLSLAVYPRFYEWLNRSAMTILPSHDDQAVGRKAAAPTICSKKTVKSDNGRTKILHGIEDNLAERFVTYDFLRRRYLASVSSDCLWKTKIMINYPTIRRYTLYCVRCIFVSQLSDDRFVIFLPKGGKWFDPSTLETAIVVCACVIYFIDLSRP